MSNDAWLAANLKEVSYDTGSLPPHATGSAGAAARAMGAKVEEEDVD